MAEKVLRNRSVFGTGLRTLGYEPKLPDGVFVTLWVTFLYFPLVPLQRALCKFEGMVEDLFFSATGSAVFSVIEKESISWSSVLRTYLLSIGVCTVLFGFAAFAFWLANGGLNMWQVVIFLCLVLAIVTFLSWKTRRDQGLLEATWEPDHLEAVNEYRNSLKEEERKKQKESQLLPTWLYTIVGLAGSATGYVLAMNMGWRFTVLKFVVFLSALPGLAILLGLDRYLVKKRAKKRASASEDWQKQNRDSWQKPE